jgi:integrase/recombinase XerD
MSEAMKALSNRCWPVLEWPAQDQAAWTIALQPGDVLDAGGVASSWAPATRWMTENGYGRWLGWLDQHGLFDPSLPPETRITEERVAAYRRDLSTTTAPFSVQTRIRQLGSALRAMAPQGEWAWILRAADRLRTVAVPVRDKRSRLQSPDRLAELGMQIMAEAETAMVARETWRAADYRDGLIIALLAHRPIRACNITVIECGRHLLQRNGGWWLAFAANETKNRQPLEMPLPGELAANLERYLDQHRPVLLDVGQRHGRPPTEALWISAVGRATSYANISLQVRRRTEAAFGKPINPHLFRDCAATSIAIADPEHLRMILPILGHASLATSERHYNQARMLEAGRRYQQTIAEIRQNAKRMEAPARLLPGRKGDVR